MLTVYSVPNFSQHKEKLLELIYRIPETPYEKISHTDWDIPRAMKRDYVYYFANNIYKGYYENLCKTNQFKQVDSSNVWFQVYREGDHHPMHTHPKSHFTNVFYVKLPNNDLKTKIRKPKDGFIQEEFKEGDIITFPAYYEHSSPINNNKEEKVVISFNINILSYANI
jgi:hypothetical protein